MEKTIELNDNVARLLDREPFLLPDKLVFNFKHIGYDLSNAFITLKNGEKCIKQRFVAPFVVPSEVLFAGNLYLKLEMYLGETKAKEWNCLPLKIVETDNGLEVNDFLELLEKKMQDNVNCLTEKINEFITKHNELAETVSAIKENY